MVQGILRLPEYQGYCDELGHAESETEMSDLEVNEPQLFDVLKKTTRKRPKRYKGKVHTRKAQPKSKVKKLTLRNEQAAGVSPIRSRMANPNQQESEQETHFLPVPAGQTSFPPGVFQGAQQPSSLISVGPNLDVSSSVSELVEKANWKAPVFSVNIPERFWGISPSREPKNKTKYEESRYTDGGEYPMVNRTHERLRKNQVAPIWSKPHPEDGPIWSKLHLEDDRQLREPMETSDFEMLNYLEDDLFGDVEMGMNEDNTGK